ncbi:hypothetical protein SprV_0902685900 [Sparganum proliferum]
MVAITFFIDLKADSPLFLTANGTEKNNRLLESTAGAYNFSWLVYVGNMNYAEADTNTPVVRYCNIGEDVLGKSIYLLEGKTEKLIQTFVWRRLNGADVYIKGTYYQTLWLQGVQPDDVMCRIKENILTCRIEPDNLRIYWLSVKSPSTQILDTLTVKEAFTFTASMWRCYGYTLILDLERSTQARSFAYTPEYTNGQVNVSSAIFAILERAFQHGCTSRTDYNIL